jgi:filamentous hemagglutinin
MKRSLYSLLSYVFFIACLFSRSTIQGHGKKLKDAVESTRFSYKRVSKIFRAVKDIVEYGIKKGDWLYLDKMHGDHIEVFKKCGKVVRTVLNMDGTVNAAKLAAAAGRDIWEWIH